MNARARLALPEAFQLGRFTVRPQLGQIEGPHGLTRLEPKVMDLLVYLAARSGTVISRTEIIDRVWRGVLVSDTVISRAVYQIRKAMVVGVAGTDIIETVPKRGYGCLEMVRAISIEPLEAVGKTLRLAVMPFENLSPEISDAFFTDGLHEEILSTLARRVLTLEVISRTTMMRYRREPPRSIAQLAEEVGATHVIEGSVRRSAQHVRVTLQLIDARSDRHLWAQSYDRTLGNAMTLQSEVASEVASQLSMQLTGSTSLLPTTGDALAYDLYLQAKLDRQLLNPTRPFPRFSHVESLLTEAIARDPAFAAAHVERMRVRAWMVEWNYDSSLARHELVREDLRAVQRLVRSDSPWRLVAEGLNASEVEYDPQAALSSYAAAQMLGYSDSTFLQSQARLLLRADRMEEALAAVRQAAVLDPGNAVLLNVSGLLHQAAHRPLEALRLFARGVSVGAVPLGRAGIEFAFGGRTEGLRDVLDANGSRLDPDYGVHLSFRVLLLERRFQELDRMLAGVGQASLRVVMSYIGMMLAGMGRRPVAELRGWTALILGRRAAAALEGAQVLAFAQNAEETSQNRWFLRLLRAEGHLFCGDTTAAIKAAHSAVALTPRSLDAVAFAECGLVAAQVLAWAGEHDQSVSLLKQLLQPPTVGPAFICRDPLCTLPLSGHERFQALARGLEQEIRHYRGEFEAADPGFHALD